MPQKSLSFPWDASVFCNQIFPIILSRTIAGMAIQEGKIKAWAFGLIQTMLNS